MRPPPTWTLPLADGRCAAVTLTADVLTVDVSDGQRLSLPAADMGALCLGLQECAALAGQLRAPRRSSAPSSGTADMRDVVARIRSAGDA